MRGRLVFCSMKISILPVNRRSGTKSDQEDAKIGVRRCGQTGTVCLRKRVRRDASPTALKKSVSSVKSVVTPLSVSLDARLKQSLDEIAEIVLIVFDFKGRHIDQILQDAQVGCLG
jgi:hypothetical protein